MCKISIHALLAESDKPDKKAGSQEKDFYPRSPCGERPFFYSLTACRQYFYPRSPCGERRGSSSKSTRCLRISIHALLAESDAWCMSRKTPVQAAFLSTLSLRRATLPETAAVVPSRQFLSTLSLRRATPRTKSTRSRRPYFYPRSPCGERLRARAAEGQRPEISIHALLAESDGGMVSNSDHRGYFYPRSPCGERPSFSRFSHSGFLNFYPRSPCGERLSALAPEQNTTQHFYPRSPCGERRVVSSAGTTGKSFLSTLSLRRATSSIEEVSKYVVISIHALLAESDPGKVKLVEPGLVFLSTLSLRRATKPKALKSRLCVISIHALLAESDLKLVKANTGEHLISIHALLAESDENQ